jgi:predicted  nucleic acid-binding Zn-ribbon protein
MKKPTSEELQQMIQMIIGFEEIKNKVVPEVINGEITKLQKENTDYKNELYTLEKKYAHLSEQYSGLDKKYKGLKEKLYFAERFIKDNYRVDKNNKIKRKSK